jgi:hypothetical protein
MAAIMVTITAIATILAVTTMEIPTIIIQTITTIMVTITDIHPIITQ